MKKILLAFILVFSICFSSVSAEIPDGFKVYAWGTDFRTIDKDVELYYLGTNENGIAMHGGLRDVITDSSDEVLAFYAYCFYNNLLVEGQIIFSDITEYDTALSALKKKLSGPLQKSSKNNNQFYTTKNTVIIIEPWDDQYENGSISFSDLKVYNKYFKETTP